MRLLQFLTLFLALCLAERHHFRGVYMTWTVDQTNNMTYPANHSSSLAKVHFKYGMSWRRSDGDSYCTNTSIKSCQFFKHKTFSLRYGFDGYNFPHYHPPVFAGFFCERFNIEYDFTIGSNTHTLYLNKNYSYKLSSSSCCWLGGLVIAPSSSWSFETVISLKKRGSYLSNSNQINTPPQVDFIPMIQHNRYSNRNYKLPVSDPDGDMVRCRYAANFTEGGGVYHSRIPYSTLHTNCTLSISPYNSNGWYALAIMVEDFAYNYGYGRYERQSSISLQFIVRIYSTRETTIYGNNTTNCTVNGTSVHVQPSTAVTFQRSATPAYSLRTSALPQTTSRIQALDGCKYYQVLANYDRAVTFTHWSLYRCDKELFGWYRFMGNAGNRMMNSCPKNLGGSLNRCGSFYQGWIPNGALPSVSDGVVARSVCFSRHYTCSCSFTKSIMIRNCGTFHVYWLDSVPTCSLRYCGVEDKSSVVSCTPNYMRIDFDRAFYDKSLFSSITLRDTSCLASIGSYNIILGSVPGACGSTRSETSRYIVYENEVIFRPKAISGTITRDPDQRVKFTCHFDKSGYSSTWNSYRYIPISNVTGSEVGYGNFSFNFVMYTDRTYSTMHSHYPVSVQLRDWMHFEVYSSKSQENTVILIDQCFSTPTMDRNHYMKYVFINNRCPTDNTVQFHKTQNHRQRFSIQAFKFLNNSTSVYFHCLVFLCHATSTDYRCQYGCTGNNIFRGKRDLSGVSNDPPSKFYMVEREVRRAAGSQGKAQQVHEDKTKAFIGMGVAVAVLVAVVAGLAFKVAHMKNSPMVVPEPEKENRYAGSQEDLPPEQHMGENHLYDAVVMQNIGVISKEQQAEIFKDNVLCS
ncbi:uncharacterized protein LOC135693242 isoform X2 [Rhopilema esculentum]|uniref:uncharacterized protein LOC135693242 isoform X2 n=1 Tax=Rhopilema esculentum TaxID=499914 RepID=UPI0031DF264A